MNPPPQSVIREYRIGAHTFRTPPAQLYDNNNGIVRLPSAALDILQLLLENRDRLVSRAELFHSGWPNTNVAESSLDQALKVIRDYIPKNYIQNIRAAGYRYIGPCEETRARVGTSPGISGTAASERYRKAWRSFANTIISSYKHRPPPLSTSTPAATRMYLSGPLWVRRGEYHYDAVQLIKQNLKPRAFTFVIGEYGSGKSYLAGQLAFRLAEEFVSDPEIGFLAGNSPSPADYHASQSRVTSTIGAFHDVQCHFQPRGVRGGPKGRPPRFDSRWIG